MDKLQFNFTLPRLKALKPKASPYSVKDTTVPLLQARVNPKGAVTFHVRKRPKGSTRMVSVSICKLSDGLPVNVIREKAIGIIGQLVDGIDPNKQRKQEAAQDATTSLTLQEAFDAYITGKRNARTGNPLGDHTKAVYHQYMERDFFDWAPRPLLDITPTMIVDIYDKLANERGAATGRRAVAMIRSVWNFSNDNLDTEELAYGNAPVRKINKLRPHWDANTVRTRKVGADQLPEWMAAVREEGGIGGAYLEVLMLTGLRRNELAQMPWSDVDLKRRVMTFPNTKNGRMHQLPITDRVLELLRWSRANHSHLNKPFKVIEPRYTIKKITKQTGIKFSPHDLRRSFTIFASGAGTGGMIIKRLLNHHSKKDVTFTHYGQMDFEDLREPLQAIENYIFSKAKVYRGNVLQVVK